MESAPINGGNVRRMDNRHMASSYDGYRAKGLSWTPGTESSI